MIDNSLVMSAMSNGGTASVTKVTPFTRAYSLVGIKGDGNNYKYMRLQKTLLPRNNLTKPRLSGKKKVKSYRKEPKRV